MARNKLSTRVNLKKLSAQVRKNFDFFNLKKFYYQKFILDETFSDWSKCPASCKDRPVPKRFRWSSHGNVQSENCPASTAECRKYNYGGYVEIAQKNKK